MNIPGELYFTKEHEWVRIEGDTGIVGITDYAQHSLGDVTFVELPKIGADVKQFQSLATIESVKAASDIFSPVSGKVAEANKKIEDDPALVNRSCYSEGWIAKIKMCEPSEKNNLMDAAAYKKFVERLEH
ncbi:MAG TPA: glycine cleavage system protein GcvH [Candidatus Omnitrophica bacterium]|nr:glycine cleavage system protein GcvH [Candidatus Omnitrophota bacterium]